MTWFNWAEKHVARWKAWESGESEGTDTFTPRACQALVLARKEAERLNHNFLGTEHLLLGIIKLNEDVSVNVLNKMGVNLEKLRLEVEKRAPSWLPEQNVFDTPYTPRSKRVIVLAQKQAKSLCKSRVGPEHFLLGLLEEGGGVAASALKCFKVELGRTREMILEELDPNF